jgi:hypothetical protein
VATVHRRNAEVYANCAALVREVDEVARSLEGNGDPRLAQWVRRSALTLALLVAEGDRRRAVVEVERVMRDLDVCSRRVLPVAPALRGLDRAEKLQQLLAGPQPLRTG